MSEEKDMNLSIPESLLSQGLRGAAMAFTAPQSTFDPLEKKNEIEMLQIREPEISDEAPLISPVASESRSIEASSSQDVLSEDEALFVLPLSTKNMDTHKNSFHGASESSAVFNLSTTIVGAGIMAFPATLKVLGLPLGVLTIFAMAWLTQLSLDFLLDSSVRNNCWSYSEVVQSVLGRKAKIFLQISIIVNSLGICMAYMIIIGTFPV